MRFDRILFGGKLARRREAMGLTQNDLAAKTGVGHSRLSELEIGGAEPTGDEVLIFASALLVDFRHFVSSDRTAPDDQLDVLFRKYGSQIGGPVRTAIAELLYLCETADLIQTVLHRKVQVPPVTPTGTYFRRHAEQAASAVREHLGLGSDDMIGDVFHLARRLGVHVFRRVLPIDGISGLTVHHRTAGPCIVVDLTEDPYRQRFTLAHELAHALLDVDKDVVVSFSKWDRSDLLEVRANAFAGHLLAPVASLVPLRGQQLTDDEFVNLAQRLEVNAGTLAIQLRVANVIDRERSGALARIRIPSVNKPDPELPSTLSVGGRARKFALLQRGLSDHYVNLCLDGYEAGHISMGRLMEALRTDETGLRSIMTLYRRQLRFDA